MARHNNDFIIYFEEGCFVEQSSLASQFSVVDFLLLEVYVLFDLSFL